MQTGFIWILLSMALYGVIHSLLASCTVKRFSARVFGKIIIKYYRLFFSIIAVITFLPILALVVVLPDENIYRIPFPWVILTLTIQILSICGLFYGIYQTGFWNFLGVERLLYKNTKPRPMVISGLYRWVRHPLYTCSLLFIWFTPVLSWNILALNIGITAYFYIGTFFEERKLLDEFGQPYKEYMEKTPQFIPFINKKS